MVLERGLNGDENKVIASTVKDLIDFLSSFPPDSEWYGYDDESIIIMDKGSFKQLGYAQPYS